MYRGGGGGGVSTVVQGKQSAILGEGDAGEYAAERAKFSAAKSLHRWMVIYINYLSMVYTH